MGAYPKFKEGDILSPLKRRVRSNDVHIANLKKVKVLKIENHPYWRGPRRDYEIYVEVLEGFHVGTGFNGRRNVNLFSDAFELASDEVEYELW